MLLPDNIAPEDSIYYNGAIILKIIQEKKNMSLSDLYCEVKKQKDLSFSLLILCLDWLFLIDCVIVKNGEVILCS